MKYRNESEQNPSSPGERLKQLRSEAKLTQRQVAQKINFSDKQIGYMETGKRSITRQAAHLLSEVFKVDEAWILCETDFRNQEERFRSSVNDSINEGNLLYAGTWAFAELSGYNITPPDLHDSMYIKDAISALKAGYLIEKDGKTVTLSLEEMNRFENLLCDLVESALKYLFKEKEGVTNGQSPTAL